MTTYRRNLVISRRKSMPSFEAEHLDDLLGIEDDSQLALGRKFIYDPQAGGYCMDSQCEYIKHIMSPKEYVRRFNKGEFEDNDESEFGVYCKEDSYVIISEQKRKIKNKNAIVMGPGIFETTADSSGNLYFKKMTLKKDQYYELSTLDKELSADVDYFLNNAQKYTEMRFAHRRGMLLFGPPGCGKSMAIEQIAEVYHDKARIIYVNKAHLHDLIRGEIYRAISDLPIILIIEEITSFMTDDYSTAALLSFLDGEKSWDNILILTTTNYPELLPDNFIDRPSRFDKVYKVNLPDDKVRELYLSKLLNQEIHTSLIKQTDGLSLAYLKELVVASKIYGKSISETLKQFKNRKTLIKNNFNENKHTIGFESSREQEDDQKKRSIGFNPEPEEGAKGE